MYFNEKKQTKMDSLIHLEVKQNSVHHRLTKRELDAAFIYLKVVCM